MENKAGRAVSREDLGRILQSLLGSRFHLALHHETRELKVYELVIDRGGPKIHAVPERARRRPSAPVISTEKCWQLAELISIQLSIPAATEDPSRPSIASGPPIPVFDKTGLPGVFDFEYDMKVEPGLPAVNLWQNVLQQQLGLKLDSRKEQVEGVVVDGADRIPVAN